MKYQLLLFDLDGTLTDPKEGITKSAAYALKHFGIEVAPDNLTAFIGPPLKDSFMQYYDFSEEQAMEAISKFRERFSEIGIFENKVFPGIHEMLQALIASGKTLALATSKPEIFARRILEKYELDMYFEYIVGSEINETRTKKSEVIEEVLKQAQISGEALKQCLMIGDRKQDVEGAKACQLDSLGVEFGYAEEGELEAAGANYIAMTVKELQDFLLCH